MEAETKCGTIEYYSTIKRNAVLVKAKMWLSLKDAMLSEIR
jgi:hypothetical protein